MNPEDLKSILDALNTLNSNIKTLISVSEQINQKFKLIGPSVLKLNSMSDDIETSKLLLKRIGKEQL